MRILMGLVFLLTATGAAVAATAHVCELSLQQFLEVEEGFKIEPVRNQEHSRLRNILLAKKFKLRRGHNL